MARFKETTGTTDFLHVPRTKTSIGSQSFAVADPVTWNSLPAELRTLELSVQSFAKRLKNYHFNSYWLQPAAHLLLPRFALCINECPYYYYYYGWYYYCLTHNAHCLPKMHVVLTTMDIRHRLRCAYKFTNGSLVVRRTVRQQDSTIILTVIALIIIFI